MRKVKKNVSQSGLSVSLLKEGFYREWHKGINESCY